jgi:phenylalanyl-tRNA synthetase beta subunit
LKRAKIFEVGLTYHKTGNKYENLKEVRTLEVILDTERGVEESNTELKQILSAFLTNLGIANVRYEKSGSRAVIYKERLELGELRLDSFSLYTESLLKADKKQLRVRDRLLHKTSEDITIEVASDKQLGPVISKIKESSDKISEVYVVDSLTKDNKLAITIRIIFEDENEISREEIAKIKDSIRI